MQLKVTPLGAGQDVGRSCLLVTLNGKNIMFDCGMHMGYSDDRRFPDFQYISKTKKANQRIDAIIITHFHLDHCGALPYFTEMVGYDGPIYMTQPTKAIAPILLEDYRKIMTNRNRVTNFFTSENIKQCMKKVHVVRLHETVHVDDDLEIKAYYAGHVLGAAMFYAKVGDASCVYTGDYNMTPDRHLGAAWIDNCRPDVLITESTYATTIRDSKRCRERDFLKKVYDCVCRGGKVLIPVFALGRAQELCILLETFWDRMDLKVPIHFAVGLTEKANNYYKMFINWTNEKIKKTFLERNMFDFKHISPFEKSFMNNPGAMVVFATPGMLHAGLSLELFCKWAPNANNMVIMPGYCVAGTVGHKVLSGAKQIEVDNRQIPVRLAVEHLSFSAHADAKGIMQLIRLAEPRNVMLVHGEGAKMGYLQQKITRQFNIPCTYPENGKTVVIERIPPVPIDLSSVLFQKSLLKMNESRENIGKRRKVIGEFTGVDPDDASLDNKENNKWVSEMDGVLLLKKEEQCMKLVDTNSAIKELGLPKHDMSFTAKSNTFLFVQQYHQIKQKNEENQEGEAKAQTEVMQPPLVILYELLKEKFPISYAKSLNFDTTSITVNSVVINLSSDGNEYIFNWKYQDEIIFEKIMELINNLVNEDP